MTSDHGLSLSDLPAERKSELSASFGNVASQYGRYRPGPSPEAVDWLVPHHLLRVVDLGAGTGALTRLLVDKADEVIAVEPDDRMRAVLSEELPQVIALAGRGEAIPVEDASAGAVLASTSWHWMDTEPTLREVARVLQPGGVLGVLWSGPDPEGKFLRDSYAVLAGLSASGGGDSAAKSGLAEVVMGNSGRPPSRLEIPEGFAFTQPERKDFCWSHALTADDVIGLLGTFSWVITLPEDDRNNLMSEARRLLSEYLGLSGDVTTDVEFRAETFRSYLIS